ncbi:hypothetical protein UF10_05845 [Peptostreptococcus russellii]|uniref:Uncharacterized protein n=1 Tax=Peptostreptococcus russellii TaxID=215200 RepID=A0A2P7Q0H5_9FIRM|nr:hypothetical protein [Peptostreptococcus russellii]PSJ31440.1 hypothetical protein UF10_05845 [Peptostreptococcus russellii]
MNKKILITAVSLFVVGAAGSLYTAFNTIPKLDKYVVERREELVEVSQVLESTNKVNTVQLGDFPNFGVVNIKKSPDNKVRVNGRGIKGVKAYDASISEGVLKVESTKENINGVVKTQADIDSMNPFEFISLITSKDIVKDSLDELALSGARFERGNGINPNSPFDESVYKLDNSVYSLDIELPEGVNLEQKDGSLTSGMSYINKYNIEDNMIKDHIKASDIRFVTSIEYNNPIKKLVMDYRNINTKDGIDFRYYLIEKVRAKNIPAPNSVKQYSGVLEDNIKKLNNDSKLKTNPVSNPELVINAREARISED